VTRRASNLVEEFGALLGRRSLRELRVARRSFSCTHKASEVIDIGEPVWTGPVTWLGSGIAEFCDLVRKEPIRDSDFIEVGIGLPVGSGWGTNPVVQSNPTVNVPGTRYGLVAQERAATEFSAGNVGAVQTDLESLGYELELVEVKIASS
jgi:hypothetical protein